MLAHLPPSRLSFFQRVWKRLFFWQKAPAYTTETTPASTHDKALVAAIASPSKFPGWKQLRYISHIFSEKERVQFWSAVGASCLFFLAGSLLFLQPHIVREPARGGTLAEGLIGSPKWVNPVLAPLNDVDRDLVTLLFSGLFREQGLTYVPDLAASYQLLDEGQTLEVHLREDARFHDGQTVGADDVEFTVNQAIKNPAWHSPLAENFGSIQAIRVNDMTVQFRHATAALTLPAWQKILTVGILPGHRWQDANDASPQLAEYNLKPIGSGPYRFDSFTRDTKGTILAYTLLRFDGYYGKPPYIDERVFRFYADRSVAEIALESNQIDVLAFVPWSQQTSLRVSDATALKMELPQVTTVFFNTQDAFLKNLDVRRALQMTIDRGSISEIVRNSTPLQTPFPFFETYATSSNRVNIELARETLDSAGWKLDPMVGLRYLQPLPSVRAGQPARVASDAAFSTSTPLALSLLLPAQGDLALIGEYIKRQWSLVGVDVSLETLERSELFQRVLDEKTHQAVLWNALVPSDADILSFWTNEPKNLNVSRWTSTPLTNALANVAYASTTNALATNRLIATELLTKDAAALFLLRPSYAYIVPSRLRETKELQVLHPASRLLASLEWSLRTRLRWK